MINIDFLLAGCNTRCMHCCVAGGPGKQMDTEDALLCLEKLDAVAAFLPGDTDLTLDHEPMNHPAAERIIRAAAAARHIRNYHHGMTTGIALMNRKDRDDVLKAYRECGYTRFGITVHGNAAHHDDIVRRQGAYDTTVAAARYLKDSGMKLDVSLMVNRFFPGDAESVTALVNELQPDSVYCVIPVYAPLGSMDEYEACRANLPEIEALGQYLPRWKQDALPGFLRFPQGPSPSLLLSSWFALLHPLSLLSPSAFTRSSPSRVRRGRLCIRPNPPSPWEGVLPAPISA